MAPRPTPGSVTSDDLRTLGVETRTRPVPSGDGVRRNHPQHAVEPPQLRRGQRRHRRILQPPNLSPRNPPPEWLDIPITRTGCTIRDGGSDRVSSRSAATRPCATAATEMVRRRATPPRSSRHVSADIQTPASRSSSKAATSVKWPSHTYPSPPEHSFHHDGWLATKFDMVENHLLGCDFDIAIVCCRRPTHRRPGSRRRRTSTGRYDIRRNIRAQSSEPRRRLLPSSSYRRYLVR